MIGSWKLVKKKIEVNERQAINHFVLLSYKHVSTNINIMIMLIIFEMFLLRIILLKLIFIFCFCPNMNWNFEKNLFSFVFEMFWVNYLKSSFEKSGSVKRLSLSKKKVPLLQENRFNENYFTKMWLNHKKKAYNEWNLEMISII